MRSISHISTGRSQRCDASCNISSSSIRYQETFKGYCIRQGEKIKLELKFITLYKWHIHRHIQWRQQQNYSLTNYMILHREWMNLIQLAHSSMSWITIAHIKLHTTNFPIVISDPIQVKRTNTKIERKNGIHFIRNSETKVAHECCMHNEN